MAARGRMRMNTPRFNGMWSLHRLTEICEIRALKTRTAASVQRRHRSILDSPVVVSIRWPEIWVKSLSGRTTERCLADGGRRTAEELSITRSSSCANFKLGPRTIDLHQDNQRCSRENRSGRMQNHAQRTMIGIGADRVHVRNLHNRQERQQRQTHQHHGESIGLRVAISAHPCLRSCQALILAEGSLL